MKLRYLLYTAPSLSMAAEAPLNFKDAFDALFTEQASATVQAVAEVEAAKAEASKMTPEKIQSQHDDIVGGECANRDQLQSDAEAEFTNIVRSFYADHAVLFLPNEYLGSVKRLLAEESSARSMLADAFSAEKQDIQKRLDAMEMQDVVLCDGSTLNIRKSVLEDIPFMKSLVSFNCTDMVDGKIILEDSINPRLFKRLLAFLTHKKSGVTTKAPELFLQNSVYMCDVLVKKPRVFITFVLFGC